MKSIEWTIAGRSTDHDVLGGFDHSYWHPREGFVLGSKTGVDLNCRTLVWFLARTCIE